jgi:flavin reductase (DIM6/NTAB) family NADH-FMN oxidoreductase RutF
MDARVNPDASPGAAPPSGPAPLALRTALGRFATGVTVITCRGLGGAPVGLTANSFSSLSLAPPLVLWSLRRESSRLADFAAAPRFAINVLAESQVQLARHFAARGERRFDAFGWADADAAPAAPPVFAGCAAHFVCRLASQQPAGDHVLFIGEVQACVEAPVAPLVFQSGHYRLLGEVL